MKLNALIIWFSALTSIGFTLSVYADSMNASGASRTSGSISGNSFAPIPVTLPMPTPQYSSNTYGTTTYPPLTFSGQISGMNGPNSFYAYVTSDPGCPTNVGTYISVPLNSSPAPQISNNGYSVTPGTMIDVVGNGNCGGDVMQLTSITMTSFQSTLLTPACLPNCGSGGSGTQGAPTAQNCTDNYVMEPGSTTWTLISHTCTGS